MRRMITEKDVEKLDSIKPSEIEKLGKITEADIESVQATQSPKNAKANQVLTADGNGKAVYKAPSSGPSIHTDFYKSFSATGFQTDSYGNKYIAKDGTANGKIIAVWIRNDLKAGDVYIPIADYVVMPWTNGVGTDQLRIYLPDETINKYSLSETTKFSGTFAYAYVK